MFTFPDRVISEINKKTRMTNLVDFMVFAWLRLVGVTLEMGCSLFRRSEGVIAYQVPGTYDGRRKNRGRGKKGQPRQVCVVCVRFSSRPPCQRRC